MTTIRCFYTCSACKLVQQIVEVPERDPATHDVVQWLRYVAVPVLLADHRRKSPLCQPKTLTEVGIAVEEGTEHVGVKVRS